MEFMVLCKSRCQSCHGRSERQVLLMQCLWMPQRVLESFIAYHVCVEREFSVLFLFKGFIVVASCVMTFEARDSAAKVVPARFKLSSGGRSRSSGGRRTTSKQIFRKNTKETFLLFFIKTAFPCFCWLMFRKPQRMVCKESNLHFNLLSTFRLTPPVRANFH